MPAAGPLSGLLVVAIEQAVAAPTLTVRLADAGARVVKIERPPRGDTARGYDGTVHGTSAYFAWLNRGKESALLDLKTGRDLALARSLIARADIFVQNLAPGAAARLGFGADELVARHPRLVAVDIVGYRRSTAYRDMRAYDLLVQAESGICAVTGTPDTPSKVGVSIADVATGLNAYQLVLEALIARGATGRGRAIEVAMFDGMADWMAVPLLHQTYAGRDTGRHGLSHASIYPYGRFACRDGDLVVAVQHHAEWERFCAGVISRPELTDDPRFTDNPSRVAHRDALDAELRPIFARWTTAEAIERLEAAQIAWGRVSTVESLAAHPALALMPTSLPDGTECLVPRPAGRPDLVAGPVPSLGQHTDAIRREFADEASS